MERKAHPLNPAPSPSAVRNFAKEKIAPWICGFANINPEGGLIVVGIDDRGDIIGIDRFDSRYVNELTTFYDFLDGPQPTHKIVPCSRSDGSPDHVLLIYTPYLRNRVARTVDGKCYERRGDDIKELRPEECQELAYQKQERLFEDEAAVSYNPADLAQDVAEEFRVQFIRDRRILDNRTLDEVLRSARLLVEHEGTAWLTHAGVLLLHQEPTDVLPGAYVRYLRYEGRERIIGQQSNLIKDEIFRGPVPLVIKSLRDFLPSQMRTFTYRAPSGELVTEDEYPPAVWDEAIVNALIHRSYSQRMQPIRIDQYEDRFEVTSPGDYPPGVSPDNFYHVPRNPHFMDALRCLAFVKMADEGTRVMRQEMRQFGLREPDYSPVGQPRVTCTLYNDISRRMRLRTNGEDSRRLATAYLNLFTIDISGPPLDPNAPFSERSVPGTREIRLAFNRALQQRGYSISSLTGDVVVDFRDEYKHRELQKSRLVSIYPGFQYRLMRIGRDSFLCLDPTVEVRNRANVNQIHSLLPWLQLQGLRCFAKTSQGWQVGHIVSEPEPNKVTVTLIDNSPGENSQVLDADAVIPALPTYPHLSSLLQAAGVKINLAEEIRRLSLISVPRPALARAQRTLEIAERLARQIFPLYIGEYVAHLRAEATRLTDPTLRIGRRLREPRAQFDKEGRRQYDKILEGLSEAGAYQKPEVNIPLVTLCPPDWAEAMAHFIQQLQRGSNRYPGAEQTFGIRFAPIMPVTSSVEDYESHIKQIIANLKSDERPVFVIFVPEKIYSRADYTSPYYKIKRLLLEAGYPSQMVKEETLEIPRFKDLNFTLDIFAKAGYIPWVLAEGLPQADLFIGLSYSSLHRPSGLQRLVEYVNVFDSYGRWQFYRGASEAISFEQRGTQFAGIMARVIDEQVKLRRLRWIHIHHAAKLSQVDYDTIIQAIKNTEPEAKVSFVHINQHSLIRFYDETPKSEGRVPRGTYVTVSPHRFYIATTGASSYQQAGIGTPRPLEVTIHTDNRSELLDLSIYAQHILSLTRLNWASTRDFTREPITTKFARDIAYLMNVFLSEDKPFRLHPALEKTPWFL
jgi:predicted HTH transcriptional regulator